MLLVMLLGAERKANPARKSMDRMDVAGWLGGGGAILLLVLLCSCRSPSPAGKMTASKPDERSSAGRTNGVAPGLLSGELQEYLRRVTFLDPLSLVHPRYIDRIKSIESGEVERMYFNYTGEISRSEVITVPEEELRELMDVLLEYQDTFGAFPMATNLSIPMLKGALASGRKSKE
jgi:hypothetical protein